MPRTLHHSLPRIINRINTHSGSSDKIIEVATTNQGKLREIRAILKGYEVLPKKLKIEEVQSTDPNKVVSEKAKAAFIANGYNPILVEDTSLEIKGIGGRPGTYVNDFCSELAMRQVIVEEWLRGKDRLALARVLLAIHDGVETHVWEGKVTGQISTELRGMNGFGWDDMFIPDGQSSRDLKTFAEMTDAQKTKYSMRKKALNDFTSNPVDVAQPIFELPEPYQQEIERVQIDELQNNRSIKFAYKLEALDQDNKPNNKFVAPNYRKLTKTENSYFSRYLQQADSKSLGLILTDVDRKHLKLHRNGEPVLWQMGPERRHLALAQRAEFFHAHQNKQVHQVLDEIEAEAVSFPRRANRRSMAIENALGMNGLDTYTNAKSLKEIGYKKLSAPQQVSRTEAAHFGLYNMVGKHARSIYGVGCLPYISGWRDVIVMSAIAHIPVFVHRNSLNAINFQNQIDLINSAKEVVRELNLGAKAERRAMANIGAAIGANPQIDLDKTKRLYKEAGVKLFRIYTINSDPRVVETARVLRQEFGDEIEIFVGQLVDKQQCAALVADDIVADGLVFGHGGGRQCTSATNGMALATLEEIYQVFDR